jgi:hypothetical protein
VSALGPVTCEDFDDVVAELAVTAIDEPDASRYQAHAGSCPRCAARLAQLALLADHLLMLAPEAEPPDGFDTRFVAAMNHADSPTRRGAGAIRDARRVPRRAVGAAALGVAAALMLGLVLGRWVSSDAPPAASGATAASSAPISANGNVIGGIELRAHPRAMVVITLTNPRPGAGRRNCQLLSVDGTWVNVGSWSYEEIATGVWAAGIAPGLLSATRMRVIDDSGATVATAAMS